MSTLGKVLVVAQVAFSVLLMAFAAGVSSVQTNWKAKATTLQTDLKALTSKKSSLDQEIEKIKTDRIASEKTLKDVADKARGEATASQGKIQQLDSQLNQTRTELQNIRAEAKIAGEEARVRRDEAVNLRTINDKLHQNRDQLIATSRGQADTIVNLEQRVRTMDDKHNQMLKDYALLQKFIRIKGFDGDPKEVAGQVEPPPPGIQAIVLNTKRGGRRGSDLVEISLGSDAGLAKGNELYVYRADGRGKYLGKIRLESVDYRTAVGVVVESTKNGEIQKGDDVTTKL
jgi:uncharacterized membrane protein